MFDKTYKKFWLFSAAAITIVALSTIFIFPVRDVYRPLHRLDLIDNPYFSDDLNIDSLIACAERQADYLKKQDQDKTVSFHDDQYTYAWLLTSVEELLAKLHQYPDATEFNHFLQNNYTVYQAGGRKKLTKRKMLVTGYYEPLFAGSLIKSPPYLTPVYFRPDSLIVIAGTESSRNQIGRYNVNNTLVPYWTRAEIETDNLLQGDELAYFKDPFDAYLLHIQGSGRIQLPDNSIRAIRFSASNGLEYKSIGKLLVDEKIMLLEEVNIPAIRTFLHRHPEQMKRILYHNPRYIFFAWGDNSGPRGSSGEVLTPGRSVAMDTSSLPNGSIAYLISRQPRTDPDGTITGWAPLNRIVFPQDSGAAIQGSGRVDVFWGQGKSAETKANHMKEEGKLYFLVKKKTPDKK